MIRDVIQLKPAEFNGISILREKSELVSDFGNEFQSEVNDLIETFLSWKIAVGISAPQVGIRKQFAIINLNNAKEEPHLIIVNPIIMTMSGNKENKMESCLSVPGVRGEVERRKKLSLQFQDRYGEKQSLNAEGFLARVILHEIDHLEGVLFIDRMKEGSNLEEIDLKWE